MYLIVGGGGGGASLHPPPPKTISDRNVIHYCTIQGTHTNTNRQMEKGSKERIYTARQLNRSRHLPTILFLYLVLHIVSHPLLVPECLGQVLQALVLLVYDLLLTQSDLVISAQSSTVVSI